MESVCVMGRCITNLSGKLSVVRSSHRNSSWFSSSGRSIRYLIIIEVVVIVTIFILIPKKNEDSPLK